MKVSLFKHAASALIFSLACMITGFTQASAQADEKGVWESVAGTEEYLYLIRPLPEAIGFAFTGDGTTGGAGGQEITVTNAEELLRFATRNDPYIINVVDTIEIVRGIGGYTESNGEYHLGSNTTLRGVGPNATILYGGFRVQGVENVIIQNLNFDGTYEGFNANLDQDIDCSEVSEGRHRYKNGECLGIGEKGPTDNALEITEGSERVWITQNSFQRYSDEVMSIKREASYVTLSWNRYDDPVSGKDGMMILIGHSDGHTADAGRLKTTIHHNVFGARDRQPRVRFGEVHILNNYYHDPHGIFSYGAAAQRDSEVVMEGNYFDHVTRPWRTDINDFQGYVDQRNNVFDETSVPATRGTIGEEIFEPQERYEYPVDDPGNIPEMVMAGVGAGNWNYTLEGEKPAPGVVYRVSPGFGETTDTLRPAMTWQPAFLATEHQLQISRGIGFSDTGMVVDTTVSSSSVNLTADLAPGTSYFWRVRGINEKGPAAWTDPGYFTTRQETSTEDPAQLPMEYRLEANYPNPFNPATTISYALPEASHVTLRVYDVTGRQILELVQGEQNAGTHTVQFNAGNLASGVYLYRLTAESTGESGTRSFSQTKRMTLVK